MSWQCLFFKLTCNNTTVKHPRECEGWSGLESAQHHAFRLSKPNCRTGLWNNDMSQEVIVCFIRTCITFWLSVQQKGIYTEYLIIGKETSSPKISLLSPFHSFYGFIRTFSSLHTPVVFLLSLQLGNREIGAWPAKKKLILWRMPDVWLLYYHILKGSGAWIHLLLVSIKYVQPNWKTLSDWYKWK